MEYIKSKDIYLMMRDLLKLVHPRPVEHGERVAYIVYKILAEQNKYEEFELADIVMTVTLHDIGAYKTEQGALNDTLRFETKDTMAHSIYGYLFFKFLSPVPDLAKIIMYHHTDYEQLQKIDYEFKDIAACVNLAEKIDVYTSSMGSQFDVTMFQKQAGSKISPTALERFYECDVKYDILGKIRSGEYKKELDDIIDFMLFSNEDKKKFLEMLMYCMGFMSESTVVDTITTICICEELAECLSLAAEEKETLYYGALIHDIGMFAIPRDIIDAPRKLEPEEIKLLRTHVEIAGEVLSERMSNEVVSIALAHHERGDGSGYPLRMKDFQMNQQQRILQIADMVSAMANKRSYRDPLPKDKIVNILNEEVEKNRMKKQIVHMLVLNYETIMEHVQRESAEIMKMYQTLNLQYDQVSKKFKI